MKKNTLILMAALIATIIMGAKSGNNESQVYTPETTALETEALNH